MQRQDGVILAGVRPAYAFSRTEEPFFFVGMVGFPQKNSITYIDHDLVRSRLKIIVWEMKLAEQNPV
jgi:hypothetical protein